MSSTLKIIYENGQPHGIRDRGGYLFFFREISKYSGQEKRYREEIERAYSLADYLLEHLHNWEGVKK